MSVDATRWAWSVHVEKSTERLVLLSLADRANEDNECYPSMQRVTNDTMLDIKTVKKVISDLIQKGLILDTGERKGFTQKVRVLRLIGVDCREDKQTQKRNDSKNGMNPNLPTNEPKIGSNNEPKIGSQNLKENLTKNLKNNSDFFDSFWQEYPNKTAKQAAIKAWSKLKLNDALFNTIIDALKKQKPHFKTGFIPHASTWLNGKRWEDEVQEANQQPTIKTFEKIVTPENASSASDFIATKKQAISEEEKARRKEFLAAQRQQNGESA